MCLGGHLVRRLYTHEIKSQVIYLDSKAFRAAFDRRVLSSVCFFATDIHAATLGAGGDDSLVKVRNGDLAGKGELVVSDTSQDGPVDKCRR
jgi:carboxymethylenebutenolidase